VARSNSLGCASKIGCARLHCFRAKVARKAAVAGRVLKVIEPLFVCTVTTYAQARFGLDAEAHNFNQHSLSAPENCTGHLSKEL
jgi:hypothetical protein